MKKLVSALVIILLICLLLVGQSKVKEVNTSKMIIDYLEGKNYKVIFYKGKVKEYILNKEDISYRPNENMWAVQEVNPEDYVGQKIETYEVTVKNHILDNIEVNKKKQTIVSVLIADGEIVGGTSQPDLGGLVLVGGFYSLEGKTLEDINDI